MKRAITNLLAGLGVPYVLPVALGLLAVLSVVTVVQRIVAVRRQLKPPSGSGA